MKNCNVIQFFEKTIMYPILIKSYKKNVNAIQSYEKNVT